MTSINPDNDIVRFINNDPFSAAKQVVPHALIVECYFDIDDVQLLLLADKFYHEMTRQARYCILFDIHGEGLPYHIFRAVHQVICPVLKEKYNFDSVYLLTGLHPIKENAKMYLQHCKAFDVAPLANIIFSNSYENGNSHIGDIQAKIHTNAVLKNKKFLCWNRNPRPHRLALFSQILQKDLLKYSYYSFYGFGANIIDEVNSDLLSEVEPIRHKDIAATILDSGLLPLKLVSNLTESLGCLQRFDIPLINDVYFTVVTETNFYKDIKPNTNCSLDSFFFTEKIFKAIASKRPFVIVTRPYSLHILNQLGYKTFHPWINETYDSIDDDYARMDFITDEIDRLCRLSDHDWILFQEATFHIAIHNYNLLANSKVITKNLQDILSSDN